MDFLDSVFILKKILLIVLIIPNNKGVWFLKLVELRLGDGAEPKMLLLEVFDLLEFESESVVQTLNLEAHFLRLLVFVFENVVEALNLLR